MSNEKMSADDLIGEIERIESAMEYTSATIAPGNLIQGSLADWREVHKGRANSSYNQLRNRINTIPALRAAVAALIAERDALRNALYNIKARCEIELGMDYYRNDDQS